MVGIVVWLDVWVGELELGLGWGGDVPIRWYYSYILLLSRLFPSLITTRKDIPQHYRSTHEGVARVSVTLQ